MQCGTYATEIINTICIRVDDIFSLSNSFKCWLKYLHDAIVIQDNVFESGKQGKVVQFPNVII